MAQTAILSLSYPPPILLIKCAGTTAIMAMHKIPQADAGDSNPKGNDDLDVLDGDSVFLPSKASMTKLTKFPDVLTGSEHS